jgi:type IV secretion system protein VirB8
VNMPDRQGYFEAAQSWGEDIAARARRSERTAWIVAGVAALLALVLGIALAVLLPLKTVEPYVVTVDRQTGAAQVVQTLTPGALTQNQAVTQASLVRYVTLRETFDRTDLAANYREVQLMSAPAARTEYLAAMNPNNPASPLKALPPEAKVSVTVRSVSLLGPDSALVRFDTIRDGAVTPYAAAIAFAYSGEPMRAEDRFLNPLGFQVTRYRRDAETVVPR